MVKIDDNYRIVSDGKQFQLVKTYKPERAPVGGRKPKEVTETVCGYYSNILHALNAYRKQRMLEWVEHEKLTFDQLIERIAEMDKKLTAKMKAKGFDEMEEKT